MECPCIAASFGVPDQFEVLTAGYLVELRIDPEEMGEGLGEVVITNLINRTQPFIRYRTGDLVRISNLPSISLTNRLPRVLGRVDDILTLLSGRQLAHHHAHDMFMAFHECEQWKFLQKEDGSRG